MVAAIDPDRIGERLGFNRSGGGIITFFDRNGREVLQYPSENWDWRQRGAYKDLPAIRVALGGKETVTTIPHFLDGKKRIAAMVPVPMNGWIVCASRPTRQVFQPIIHRIVRQGLFFVLLVIFVFAIAMFFSQRIVSPLKKLHQHALALGSSTEYPTLEIDSSDEEIKDLAFAFNKMTTEISKREKALDEARLRLLAVLEGIPAFVYLQGPDCEIKYANRTFRETFGDPEGKPCHEVLRGENSPCAGCTVDNIFNSRMVQDWKWRSVNGRIYHMHDRPFEDFDGTCSVLKMGLDITEQEQAAENLRQSEEQSRQLALRLFSAQEEERKRIAGELHDSVMQTLVAMKFSIERAVQNPDHERTDEADRSMKLLFSLIDNAMQEMRAIYSGLRPPMLDKSGIIATLDWLCQNFQKIYPTHQLEAIYEIKEQEIADRLQIIIFRVAQEALNNIAKYSKSEHARISLVKTEGLIRLDIMDDGVGFDMENHRQGLGLISMRERVELSGGNFKIESRPGHGTAITAEWPQVV